MEGFGGSMVNIEFEASGDECESSEDGYISDDSVNSLNFNGRKWARCGVGKRREDQLKEKSERLTDALGMANLEIVKKETELRKLKRELAKVKIETKESSEKEKEDLGVSVVANCFQYERQERHPISIFPEEIWVEIFRYLEYKDLKNCFWTCSTFQSLPEFNSKKPLLFFGKVLPHLSKVLDKRHILKCRKVCKEWCQEVDSFLQNHPYFRAYDERTHDPSNPVFYSPSEEKKISEGVCFTDRNLQRLLRMQYHKRNPLPGRIVAFKMKKYDRDWTEEALEKLQKSIYHLKVKFSNPEDFANGIYNILYGCDELRSLDIEVSSCSPGDPRQISDWALPGNGSYSKLETLKFRSSTFYNLEYIKRYDLNLLKLLETTQTSWSWMYQQSFENLVELRLTDFHFSEYLLTTLRDCKLPQLKKLELNLKNDKKKVIYSEKCATLLLSILNHLSNSSKLKVLRLSGLRATASNPVTFLPKEDPISRFQFFPYTPPELKTLELLFCEDINPFLLSPTFNFLLCFPFLENLNVTCIPSLKASQMDFIRNDLHLLKRKQGLEIVEIHSHIMSEEQMEQSNIWKLLPRLKVFTFKNKVFTRPSHILCSNGK